jgi:integrase
MALQAHRHLRGKRVPLQASGEPLTIKIVQDRIARAARTAGVRPGVHILRHTFLFASGDAWSASQSDSRAGRAPGSEDDAAILHLSPAAIEGAIRLLDAPRTGATFGNMLATGSTEITNASR